MDSRMFYESEPVICRNFLTHEIFKANIVCQCQYADTCWWVKRIDTGEEERMYYDEMVRDRGQFTRKPSQ